MVTMPIKSPEMLLDALQYLKNRLNGSGTPVKTSHRDYIMFCIGIYTGLRITDLLSVRVADFHGRRFRKIERKNGKIKDAVFPDALMRDIDAYIKDAGIEDYLFPSVRKDSKHPYLTRVQAWRIMTNVGKQIGEDQFACHSLRKIHGLWIYFNSGKDIARTMHALGHSSPAYTLRYLGIKAEEDARILEEAFEPLRERIGKI